MSWVAVAVAGSEVVGAVASNAASKRQAGAAGSAAQMQWDEYLQNREDQAPWRQAGATAIGQLGQLTATGGDLNRNFAMSDFQADPGYQFRMDQGMKALQGTAAARGGLLSGGAAKASLEFAQGLGSQEYQNAFNRFETQNNDRYNRLASIAGLGQSSVSSTGQLGAMAANNAGNYLTQGANAQAAGYIGMGNAINSGVSNWMDYQNMQNLANSSNGFDANAYAGQQGGLISAGSGML